MTGRNKKRLDGFAFPAPFMSVVIVATVLALAWVWLDCRRESLGQSIRALEKQKADLEDEYAREESKWMRMKAPHNLERALRRCRVSMKHPRADQVIRITGLRSLSVRQLHEWDAPPRYARLEKAVMNE
jgi:hypothetical protein